MNIDIDSYRARVGGFYVKAVAYQQLSFLNHSTLVPFIILCCRLKWKHRMLLATFVYFCFKIHIQDMLKPFKNVNSTSQTYDRPHNLKITQRNLFRLAMQTVLLYRCGDVETNPGSTAPKELCVAHVNARSIENKMDLLEAESNNFDSITLSETWLSHSHSNSSIHLPNFHEPVRLLGI